MNDVPSESSEAVWWSIRIGIGVVALAVVGTLVFLLPVEVWISHALEWLERSGPLGWIGFGVLYVAVTVCLLPTSVLTVGGGFLFGPWVGFLVVWISENVGAFVTLLIGRYLARPAVERLVQTRPRLRALDEAVEQRGFSLLVLLRHSPLVPFGLLNYTMSATKMPIGKYVAATALGTALPAFLFVYVGSTFTKLTDVLRGESGDSGPEQLIYWGGLMATLVATVGVTRAARAALRVRLAEVTEIPPEDLGDG